MKIFSLIIFAGLWGLMFWLFLVRGGENLWRQHQAEAFAATQGTVRTSEVTISYGSKGRVYYHVAINYIYPVDGQNHYCTRYRYDGHPNNRTAYAIVAAHPAGSTVTVYYDPQNPADALLSAGVDAEDVYMLFFGAAMCVLFAWLPLRMAQGWNLGGPKVAGGVKIIDDTMVTRVRLPRFQPLSAALLTAGGFSVAAGILMYLGAIPGPPLSAGGLLLVIVLIGGVGAYGWLYRIIHSGKQDLVINFAARTVQLPLTYKRREPITVSFSEIKEVALQKIRQSSRSGTYYTYTVTLEMKDGILQSLINLNEARAKSLAEWLNQNFGISAGAPVLNPDE